MNKKDFKFSSSYVELMSISDAQIQIVNANDRINLFDDPLYFILPSERIRKLILKRKLTESEYWEYFFNSKKYLCARCNRPLPIDDLDTDSCECDHNHIGGHGSQFKGYTEDYYDGSNYSSTKQDLNG